MFKAISKNFIEKNNKKFLKDQDKDFDISKKNTQIKNRFEIC